MNPKTLIIASVVLASGVAFFRLKPSSEGQMVPSISVSETAALSTPAPTPVVPTVAVPSQAPVIQKRSLTATGKPSSPTLTAARSALSQVPGRKHGRPWEEIPDWSTLSPKARLSRLLSAPFGIQESGQVQILELATDELWLAHPPEGMQRSQKIEPQADVDALLAEAERLKQRTGSTPQLVLYPADRERDDYNRRVISEEIVLHGQDAAQLARNVKAAGFAETQPLDIAPGFVIAMDRRFPGSSLIGAADLSSSVAPAEAQLAVLSQKRYVPNDALFSKQWHLSNNGSVVPSKAGIDAGITTTWDSYKGDGINISIVDDGVEHTHPDLTAGYLTSASYDLVGNDNNPLPGTGDIHGTCVAGVATARAGNSIGVAGAAPNAMFGAIRLLGTNQAPTTEARALGFGSSSSFNAGIHISSNSWGPPDTPYDISPMSTLVRGAIVNGITNGRGGKGIIYLFAGGNGREWLDQSNKDGYANCIYVNAIGAITSSGLLSYYSETGANIIACAPSDGGSSDPGIVTTDRSGNEGYNDSTETKDFPDRAYTKTFGGTSSATPLASGVVALMLEANPNLGWRDVKEILLRSGQKLDPASTGWVSRTGDKLSLPPIKHHHSYGGGMIRANLAVPMAETWQNLGPRISEFKSDIVSGGLAIPDNNTTGITRSFDFSGVQPIRVEQVEVHLSIEHDYRGDLRVDLISPSGVTSTLMTKTPYDDGTTVSHLFSSNRHWGEGSKGIWRLRISDQDATGEGQYFNATVTLYGEAAPPALLGTVPTGDFLLRAGVQSPALEFDASGTGRTDLAFTWKRGTTTLTNGVTQTPSTSKYSLATVTTSNAGNHTVTVANATGNQTSTAFRVGVVSALPPASIFNVNSTITLTAPATLPTGATASYQWKKDGNDLVDDPVGPTARIKGSTTKTLTILKAVGDDAASYECFVVMGSANQSSGPTALTIRFKPEIQLAAFPTDWIVSRASPSLGLDLTNGSTKVTITGLPSGMTYNRVTGEISGTPSVAVTNKPITISVTNLAGTTTKVINLTVEPLAPMVVGTFNGLVGRHNLPSSNGNFGGAITSLVVSQTGSFSGKVQLASQPAWSFSGRLNASTTADPSASVEVRRRAPLGTMILQFSINRDTGHLAGTLSEQPTWSTSVDAWRRTPSLTVGLRHNFTMDPGAVDSALMPAGFSAGYLTHTPKTGAVTAVVKLSDGTTVTRTTSRGFTGDIPIFSMLYANKGSLHGKLVVTDAASPVLDPMTGSFTWNKTGASSSKDYIYPAGFDFGVAAGSALPVEGSEYVAPIKAALPNPPNILWGITDVPVGQANTILDFTGAGVETSAYYLADPSNINKTLRISSTHSIAFPLPNLAAVKLTLSASTGQISGTVTLKDGIPTVTRTLSYFGVVLSPQAKAKGWFKLTQLPGPQIQSGKVELNELQ